MSQWWFILWFIFMQHASIDPCFLWMFDFKVTLQLLFCISLLVFSIDCGKSRKEKKAPIPRVPGKFASVTKSKKSSTTSSSSSTAATPRKKATTVKTVTQTSAEVSALPTQLREIMEAERMAKQQKGYDSVDIDIDDEDLKK